MKEIAAQLERRVVAEATQNLRRNLLTSTSDVSLNYDSEFGRTVTFNNTTLVLPGFI